MINSEENTISPIHTERKRSINSDDHSPKSASLKRPRLDIQNQEFKDRGKRMLGMIFNTLNQFKKDTSEKTEAEKRREEIENKLRARLEREKKEIEEEINDDEQRRQRRKEEGKRKLREYCNKQNTYKSNFIRTKATPCIYYLPAILNNETRKILEDQKGEVLKKISLNTGADDLTSPTTATPLSAKSDVKDSKIPPLHDKKDEEEDKDKSVSPVDKEAKTKETDDDAKKEDGKQDMDIEEGEVNEDGDEKEKLSNESSKMSDPRYGY